jgi:hypothetical protein
MMTETGSLVILISEVVNQWAGSVVECLSNMRRPWVPFLALKRKEKQKKKNQ